MVFCQNIWKALVWHVIVSIHAGEFSSNKHVLPRAIPTYPLLVLWVNTHVSPCFYMTPTSLTLLNDPEMDTWHTMIWVSCLWFFLNLAFRELFSDRSYNKNCWWPCCQPWEGMKQKCRKRQRWKTERVLAAFKPTAVLLLPQSGGPGLSQIL